MSKKNKQRDKKTVTNPWEEAAKKFGVDLKQTVYPNKNEFYRKEQPLIDNDFINPYTFLEIPQVEPERKTLIDQDSYDELLSREEQINKDSYAPKGNLTGMLECTMTVESPTFIPNTTMRFPLKYITEKEPHYFYEFNSYDDLSVPKKTMEKNKKTEYSLDEFTAPRNPVIPGSEIRGMVRNVYEQLTNSCFLIVDEDNWPYKRTPLPKIPVLLKMHDDGKWRLHYDKDTTDHVTAIDAEKIFCRDKFAAIEIDDGKYFTKLNYAYDKNVFRPNKYTDIVEGDKAFIIFNDKGNATDIYTGNQPPARKKNKEITVKKTNTMWYEKRTGNYKLGSDTYDWGDTVYLPETSKMVGKRVFTGLTKKLPDSIPLEEQEKRKRILHLVPTMQTKKYFLAYREDNTYIESLRYCDILEPDEIERFERVLDSYCDPKINKMDDKEKIRYYEKYRKMYKGKKTLLVYVNDFTHDQSGGKKYISPSSMTKEFFINKISEKGVGDSILKKQAKHDACRDKMQACPACRLFGMVGSNGSLAGRIRFTDSYSVENLGFIQASTLPILGTPRISATEFYLKKPEPDARMWNYDYWVKEYERRSRRIPPDLRFKAPELRGRKVYWQGYFKTETEKNNMNCTVRPLAKGSRFNFKVYFEDLTDEELRDLVFCLRLNGKGLHRIGKGKPIGMGVVKIEVTQIGRLVYSLDADGFPKRSYKEEALSEELLEGINERKYLVNQSKTNVFVKDETGDDLDTVAQILRYTDPAFIEPNKRLVGYPSVKGAKAKEVFRWFVKNRGSAAAPTVEMILPSLMNNKQTLPKYNG